MINVTAVRVKVWETRTAVFAVAAFFLNSTGVTGNTNNHDFG